MKRRWTVALEIALLLALLGWVVYSFAGPGEENKIDIKVRLEGTRQNAHLAYRKDSQTYQYEVTRNDGSLEVLTPDDLAKRTFHSQKHLTWWMRLLNITGPFEIMWVTIGLLGQVLFTGRMIVQWLVSEKEKKSVVPPVFWWMSLAGASMLVLYFIWRRDPIGVLGQAVGWFVYIRNLWMIYRPHPAPAPTVTQDPAPEPELSE